MNHARRDDELAIGVQPAQLGLWIFMATVAMLFAAFISAYLIRRAGAAWGAIAMPDALWLNTAVLLASSATLEMARRASRKPAGLRLARQWLNGTLILGLFFLVGQVLVWRLLVQHGIYVPTSPHSSFFYIFTGLHGAHLGGGLVLLLWGRWRLGCVSAPVGTRYGASPMGLCATYWHFMGALWIALLLVLVTL